MSVQIGMKARALVSEEEFAGVTATVLRNNHGMTAEVAGRIVEEALKFVVGAAHSPGRGLRPSRIVDEGWHALILHTGVYRGLCTRLGRFIDHVPEPPMEPARFDPDALTRTQDAIREAGFEPDPMLWLAPWDNRVPVAADCQHTEGGEEGTCVESCAPSGPN